MGEAETLPSASPQYKMGLQFSESEVHKVGGDLRVLVIAGKRGGVLILEEGY